MANPNIEMLPLKALRPWQRNARTPSKKQVRQIANGIETFGFTNPALVDKAGAILAGHGRVAAAKLLGMSEVPCVRFEHMSAAEKRAYVLADNKLALNAEWDEEVLAVELEGLLSLDADFDVELTGFSLAEVDGVIETLHYEEPGDPADEALPEGDDEGPVCHEGDVWQLGPHRLVCGNALDADVVKVLMDGEWARMVFTDPPYNVPIDGHVCGSGKTKHREFAMATGEILAAGKSVYSELKNLIIWVKDNGGMGTFCRSRHELIFAFKAGTAAHINTFELGQHGRYRTNIWEYKGVNTRKAGREEELALHPTVKPVQMIADALRDCSGRGDTVLDLFGGSGSTLIAAHKTARRAYLAEIDPLYCATIIRRWEAFAHDEAVRLVDALARNKDGKPMARLTRCSAMPGPGSQLIREWNGRTHRVEAGEAGFTWSGVHYASLSAVARAITGARWSGPRFFGLRQRGAP